MQLSGNTVLGGTGYDRGLAEGFHKAGCTVIMAGRREKVLKATAPKNQGMELVRLYMDNPEEVKL